MSSPMTVLGIEVPDALLASWAAWLAPDPQPFVVAPGEWLDVASDDGELTPEHVDTFSLWAIEKPSRVLWLSEDRFHALPRERRAHLVREQVRRRRGAVPTVRAWEDVLDPADLRAQADGHRFVWWRSLIDGDPRSILPRVISTRRLASRHTEVAASTWRRCESLLPGARRLAGTFADGSVTNCFGTVLAAAGADERGIFDDKAPFLEWLATACRPGGHPTAPGTVMVWREGTEVVHAAVSIGDGWALEKPSQEWHSPRAVVAVADLVRVTRYPGQRLERHTIDASAHR